MTAAKGDSPLNTFHSEKQTPVPSVGAASQVQGTKEGQSPTPLKGLIFVGAGIISPHIIEDIVLALRALRCTIDIIPLQTNDTQLRAKIDTFKPDFIFALDGKGFELPAIQPVSAVRVAWFVDNPEYFDRSGFKSDDLIFVWDQVYIEDMHRKGFSDVHFLPLATNPQRFHTKPVSPEEIEQYQCDVSFVGTLGDSPEVLRARRMAKYPSELNVLTEKIITADSFLYVREKSRDAAHAHHTLYADLPPEVYIPAYLLADYEINAVKRYEVIGVLKEFNSRVFGDMAWKQQEGGGLRFGGSADYQTAVRKIYRSAVVNVNVTRPQLRTTVNQRIFDVFCCGGFLLTDYRLLLEQLLPFPADTICFYSPEDLRAKIAYYLKHSDERQQIIALMQKEIQAKHTYLYRMEELVLHIRRKIQCSNQRSMVEQKQPFLR